MIDQDIIISAIKDAVQLHVNGKIDKLSEKGDRIEQKLDCHIKKIEPLLDALSFFQNLQRFLKWIGLPLTIVFIPLYIWFKSIISDP